MQNQLRDVNVQIAKDTIALENLKNVKGAEDQLRTVRDT